MSARIEPQARGFSRELVRGKLPDLPAGTFRALRGASSGQRPRGLRAGGRAFDAASTQGGQHPGARGANCVHPPEPVGRRRAGSLHPSGRRRREQGSDAALSALELGAADAPRYAPPARPGCRIFARGAVRPHIRPRVGGGALAARPGLVARPGRPAGAPPSRCALVRLPFRGTGPSSSGRRAGCRSPVANGQ